MHGPTLNEDSPANGDITSALSTNDADHDPGGNTYGDMGMGQYL